MKNISLFIVMSVFIFSCCPEISAKEKVFTGRIIYINEKMSIVELKKMKREVEFFISGDTQVFYKKKKMNTGDLKLCQEVRVYYSVKKNTKTALKILIIKESDCF